MSKLTLAFLFLILFSVFLPAQNVKIYGNIIDNADYSTVILSPSVSSKLLDSKIETLPKKGFFEFNISITAPCFYKLYYKEKKISLFVRPSSTVQLTIDNTKDRDYVVFYEDNTNENILLNQEDAPALGDKQQREQFMSAAQQSKQSYYKAIDEEMRKQETALMQIAENTSISNDFIDLYVKNNIEMAGLAYKYYFPKFLYLHQDSFVASQPEHIDIYQSLPRQREYFQSALYFDNQMHYVKSKVNIQYKQSILDKKVDDLELYKAYIKEASMHHLPEVREWLVENLIGEWIASYGRTIDLKDEIVAYTESIQDGNKKNQLKKRLVNLAQYETGNPAPIFSFEDYAGNKRNLREYIGKVIYLLVWRSDEKNTVNEAIAVRDISIKYKENADLIFLYLSIDASMESWEQAIRANKLTDDIQAIAFPNGYSSDFGRKYAIQQLPAAIVIDKSGNIVTRKAPLPSHPEKLVPFLNKLMGKE